MEQLNLILTLPQGAITATNLGIEGFAWHRRPGSGKYFQGRTIFVDLALSNGRPDFTYLDEGGWRDPIGDTLNALQAMVPGKRTKTALSNNAFSCTPIDAYRRMFLGRTGGQVMEMERAGELAHFAASDCHEAMTPDEVAAAIGQPGEHLRQPRLYLVFCPVEFIVLSSLTPAEYTWYSTHRPGKIFRQVLFTELQADQTNLAAENLFHQARVEFQANPGKKTKTIVSADCINRVPFHAWVGYQRKIEGGIYAGDKTRVSLWRFPSEIPHAWERAEG
jgi:hypothetical protein